MPPPKSGKKLTAAQIAILDRWIQQGAEYKMHWAFEKPRQVEPPGIAEAVNWATALGVFGESELSPAAAERTLSTVLKYSEDEAAVHRAGLATLVVPND